MTGNRYTLKEWLALGERLFGPDKKKWEFICPWCGISYNRLQFEKVKQNKGYEWAIGVICYNRNTNDATCCYDARSVDENLITAGECIYVAHSKTWWKAMLPFKGGPDDPFKAKDSK